jgi:two-component system, OmpR family, phosphate regulon sensor histidine kinase PhoR
MSAPKSTHRDSVYQRLQRLVVTMLLLLIVVGSVSVAAIVLSTGNVVRLTTGYGPANDANTEVLTRMLDAEAALTDYLSSDEQASHTQYRAARDQVVPSFDRLIRDLNAIGEHRFDQQIATERLLAETWLGQYAEPLATSSAATLKAPSTDANRMFEQFRTSNNAMSVQLQQVRLRLRQDTARLRQVAIGTTVAAAVAAVVAGAWFGARTASGIARPLASLRTVVDRLDAGDLAVRADQVHGPDEVKALASAVNSLGERSQAEVADEEIAEDLRQHTRLVSLAIRRIDDPERMAQHLIRGLGEAIGADRVVLHTFADDRVPQLTAQWHSDRMSALPDTLGKELDPARTFVDRLWETARTVRISDHASYRSSPAGQLLTAAALDAGVKASVVAPVGDINSSFGLLWVAMADRRRIWTAAEAGIIQHLAADAAHGLIQANILARNREVVERLHELDRAKADFISTVSHELRTPLTSISGYLEMLQDGDGGPIPDEATRMLEVIDRNAVRLRNLIEDLLTQSRIDAGRLRLSIERIDVRDLLWRVDRSMRPLAASGGIVLQTQLPDGPELAVDGDNPQLEQVLTNLVSNGIKFSPPGGVVTVSAEAAGPAVLLTVTDTGIGIPVEEIPELYTRFFRASNAVAAAFPGTGLGLAIVSEIIERHGGTVEVDSIVDRGTTIAVRLPAAFR